MSKVDELRRSLPDAFEGWLFEDGIKTPAELHYEGHSKLDIRGLLEELPPFLRIDWHKGVFYSTDGKSYQETNAREFDFYKLLDPRLVLNYKALEITGRRDVPRLKIRLVFARYDAASLDLPADLIDWLKENDQSTRPVVFVMDDRPMIRVMSQPDIPPSRAVVSLFFHSPGEEVNTFLICSSLLLAASAIRGWSPP
jgi:hypothetical protein